MLALGLLLLAVTGAFTGLLIAENLDGGPTYTVTMFGNDLATMNSLAIFLAGIALTLLFVLGCLMVLVGRRRSAELRAARRAGTVTAGGPVPASTTAGHEPYPETAGLQPYADRAPVGGMTGAADTRVADTADAPAQAPEARQETAYEDPAQQGAEAGWQGPPKRRGLGH
ncbi:hypothetical protein [Kitasatospora sp. KL5]|uniref:hypothetical protein n=1 Tax=Kitasatospora sp. KL5 TaxID=3425125 RepID=UPI003D6F7208